MVVHEHDPARTDGWSPEERIVGLDRIFQVMSLDDVPFDATVVGELRALSVVEGVELGLVASAPLPLAASMSRQPSSWAAEMIGLAEAHHVITGRDDVVIAVLDTVCRPAIPSTPGAARRLRLRRHHGWRRRLHRRPHGRRPGARGRRGRPRHARGRDRRRPGARWPKASRPSAA